ncbi:MAG TPA: hypothetical protein VM674_07140 [Candidatus Acidoferrum sp.]|nr:hypothetical protein [Candidatus Acidoferrum sp.]
MVNLDALQQFALDHQQELLNDAARRRLVNASRSAADNTARRPLRARLASGLRRAADRIEPLASPSRVGVLRAVAHREITIDQALRLLEVNGR